MRLREKRSHYGCPFVTRKQQSLVVPAAHREELLRLARGCEQCFAVREGNDLVVAAVRNQHRRRNLRDAIQTVIANAREQPHWQPWIDLCAESGNRSESRSG